jgi:hypothetical protein
MDKFAKAKIEDKNLLTYFKVIKGPLQYILWSMCRVLTHI